jgi:hypothetical protein
MARCRVGPCSGRAEASADREYQIAAAHFFAADYREALDGFCRIGNDASSPWNALARYLVVLTLLRMTPDGKPAPELRRIPNPATALSQEQLGEAHADLVQE